MLHTEHTTRLAHRLYRARKDHRPVPQFTRELSELSVEEAYAIQREWVRLEQADGRTIRGCKVGLTTQAVQNALGGSEPIYAPLMDDMFFETGHEIDSASFICPRVETELAFVLGRPLRGPGVTLEDVLRATAYVTPALEIIDARIEQVDRETGKPRKLVDMICDFAAAAGLVVGGMRVKPDALDLRWAGAILSRNGLIEETGLGAVVLGHPAASIAWLANKVGSEDLLRPGAVLLAGSFIKPVPAGRGDVVSADYGPLGVLSFGFT